MLRKLAYLLLLALLIHPAAGHALGLGEIRVHSSLNQQLDAEIELTNVRAGELEALQVRLAPPESFSRVGLDRPFILTQLRFAAGEDAQGRPVIKVTTREEVREPFLNFLVEANWARGRLLREYTVLLDPPVMMPAVAATPVRAPETGRDAPARQPQSEQRAQLPTPMLGRIPDDRMRPGAGEYGPVQRDDTLWTIAERVKPSADITTSQMMLALYDANPDAFYGNINHMKTGYVLRVPSREQVTSRSAADAYREASRHNDAWRTGQPVDLRVSGAGPATNDGRLRLRTPDEVVAEPRTDGAPGTGGAGDGALGQRLAEAEVELEDERDARRALAARLAELEAETQELRRLLEIRDAELEALTGARPTTPEPQVDTDTPADEPAAEQQPAVQPDRRRTVAAPAPEPEPSLLERLMNPFYLAVALGLIVLIAIALAAARRRRAAKDANRALDEEAAADDEATVFADADADADVDAASVSDADAETVVGDTAIPAAAAAAATGAAADEDDDPMTASSVMKLDDGDPASEADFHLAYGLYDQAAELMEGAYAQNPERVDYLMKLLEIYFAWGKPDEFVRHAREGRGKLEAAGEWGNVAILGRQLGGDDRLFSDMGATGARSGVDLDLEGGAAGGEAAVDLDTGEFDSAFDLGEPEADETPAPATEAVKPADDAGMDFDLGDFEYPIEEPAAEEPPMDATQAVEPASDATQAIDFSEDEPALELDADDSDKTSFKLDKSDDDGSLDMDFDAALAGLEGDADDAGIESAFGDEAPQDAAADDDALSLDFDALLADDAADESDADAAPASDSRLDLARAYIDMGDADGARTLLNEVVAEGDEAQKREAQELLALIS